MADENPPPVEPTVPSTPTEPVGPAVTDTTPPTDTPTGDDDSAEATNAVCVDGDDEDPEVCVGPALKDPWDDPFQTDWPQNGVTTE